MHPDKKVKALNRLADEYDRCTKCPNLCDPAGRTRNHVPFGTGNADADVLIVGEAAGDKEDRANEPFVGASGRLLDKLLHTVESAREEVFITNVVLCRPTMEDSPTVNRKPTPAEVGSCSERLHRTIDIVDPFVVIMLGAVAVQALTKERSVASIAQNRNLPRLIVQHRGEFCVIPRVGFATFHPSYLLRNDSPAKGGDLYMAVRMVQKAFKVADMFRHIYYGDPIPFRGDDLE